MEANTRTGSVFGRQTFDEEENADRAPGEMEEDARSEEAGGSGTIRRVVVLENTGHWLLDENSEDTSAAALSFLGAAPRVRCCRHNLEPWFQSANCPNVSRREGHCGFDRAGTEVHRLWASQFPNRN
jgi:hypothetical protein